MPRSRIYPNNAARQRDFRLREKELNKATEILPRPAPLRWRQTVRKAMVLLRSASAEMQDRFDTNQERWQESEGGQEFAEKVDALREAIETLESFCAECGIATPDPLALGGSDLEKEVNDTGIAEIGPQPLRRRVDGA